MNAATEPAATVEGAATPSNQTNDQLPPEIAKLLGDIGHALAQAPKALLLVNEEAEVISPFLGLPRRQPAKFLRRPKSRAFPPKSSERPNSCAG